MVANSPAEAKPSAAYENGWNAINQFIREDYSWNGREPNVLLVRQDGRYVDVSGVSGLDFADDSRAFAVTDFDGDGRLDIILEEPAGPAGARFAKRLGRRQSFDRVLFTGTKSNRDAIGARVEVDGRAKWLSAGSGFLSQHSKRMIFGLGHAETAARVRVTWPSGTVQEFLDLKAGKTYSIVEGSADIAAKEFRPAKPMPARGPCVETTVWLSKTPGFSSPFPSPNRSADRACS